MYLVKYSYKRGGKVTHNSVVLEERDLAPYFKRYHTDIDGFEEVHHDGRTSDIR